jgi:TRAP-type C4-dicarboxylate transport system permease small subunit
MNVLSDMLQRITKVGTIIGGIFLIVGMLLLISNIFGRFAHFVIPGSYELFELIMVVPVATALVYTAMKKGHVIVHLVVSRFPSRLNAAAEMLACLVSLSIWALIAWAGLQLIFETGLQEVSETLDIPYLPFRVVWIFCLFLFCLTYLVDLLRAFKRFFEK